MKLKQIIMGTMMGLALVVCADAEAAGCAKNQWLNGKKCAACPANAKCNGTTFTCNKNFAQKGNTCIAATCPKGQWMNGSKCAACPANAECKDGKTFKCNKNFAQKGNTCIAATCPKGQWMNGSKCAACPANAECKDGKTFKCNKNFAQKGNTCIAATCPKGQWMNGSKCAACPANAECKDGKTFACNKNFTASGNKCVQTTCAKGQWMNGSKCTACPANAECKDGKTFTCNKDYVKKGNACISQYEAASDCEKYGSHQSFEVIEKHQKNCNACGVQMGSDNKLIYYCYCGKGCPPSAVSGDNKKTIVDKVKKCSKKYVKGTNWVGDDWVKCVRKDIIPYVKDKLKKVFKKIF